MRRLPSVAVLLFTLHLSGLIVSCDRSPIDSAAPAGRNTLTIETPALSIEFDTATGAFLQVTNLLTGLDLFSNKGKEPVCSLVLRDGSVINPSGPNGFSVLSSDDAVGSQVFRFPEVEAEVRIEVSVAKSGAIALTPTLRSSRGSDIRALVFPILSGMTALGDTSDDDFLAHPSASGLLVRDPLNTLRPEKVDNYQARFVHSEYPDGYYGCPMQFMAFYDETQGGFYFGCHDPAHTIKELNFYRPLGTDYLEMRLVHYVEEQLPGKDGPRESFGYPVVLAATREGDWYEGAELYRAWVTSKGPGAPVWCQNGPKRTQSDRQCARWLQERIGVATFGISCRRDEAAWLKTMQSAMGVPVFHILGFDWETNDNSASDAAWEDVEKMWSNPANVRAIRESGSKFAVFKVDLWLSTVARDFPKLKAGSTGHEFIDGGKKKVWMCPASADWADFYALRDRTLVSAPDFACNALYNDTSVCCAAPLSCKNSDHGHPVGGKGAYMIENYRELLQRSHEACAAQKGGQRVPIGTEVITENFIDVIDFCQSRAMAGVQGAFEWAGDPTGAIESIPMFDYVYHEYGPVRLDGFGKLGRRFGDIFYLIAARVYLWGAVFELNYEFSATELFDGIKGPSHYLTYDYWTEYVEEKSPERVHKPYLDFLRRMARARLEFGRRFLCWGRMVRPLKIVSEVPTVLLDYDHYNVFPEQDSPRSGVVKARAIVSSGWASGVRLGFFFANISEKNLTIKCLFDPTRYHLRGKYSVDLVTHTRRERIAVSSGASELTLSAPARNVVMLEVRPAAEAPASVQ